MTDIQAIFARYNENGSEVFLPSRFIVKMHLPKSKEGNQRITVWLVFSFRIRLNSNKKYKANNRPATRIPIG
jgi:hypothetical protein